MTATAPPGPATAPLRILVTGGGGFLARGLVLPLAAAGHRLRLMDLQAPEGPHESVAGDVADPAAVAAAMAGVDALVIAHMAPRGPDNVNYRTPALPMAVNVGGTANLLHAAEAAGVRRVVLISSTGACDANPEPLRRSHAAPALAAGWYGLSKACQEALAEHAARCQGMSVSCLRIGYVLDGEANRDKYGRPVSERNALDTDRRDVGEVARLCLERGAAGFAVFNVMSARESLDGWDVRHTCETLGWTPRYDFAWLREPGRAAAG